MNDKAQSIDKTAKKESFNPAQFIREVRQEMSKVTWPTRKETMVSTAVVLVLIMVAAVFFLVADTLIASAVKMILGFGG